MSPSSPQLTLQLLLYLWDVSTFSIQLKTHLFFNEKVSVLLIVFVLFSPSRRRKSFFFYYSYVWQSYVGLFLRTYKILSSFLFQSTSVIGFYILCLPYSKFCNCFSHQSELSQSLFCKNEKYIFISQISTNQD